MKLDNIRIRPVALLGELVLGTIGIIMGVNGAYTEAGAVAAIIGLTMHKAIESEEKTDGNR